MTANGRNTLRMIGVDHRTSPLAEREALALGRHRVGAALDLLRRESGCREVCIVSTCLRTEVYAFGGHPDLGLLGACSGAGVACAGPTDVARRLFRVAAGLESLVLGESEILGQVKQAYQIAAGHGATGPILSGLFERALASAKRVRSRTALGAGAVSMPSLAVQMAEDAVGPLANRVAVVLGTGDMARVAAQRLVERRARVHIASRRLLERARALAAEVGAEPRAYDDGLDLCTGADAVVCATAAPHVIAERSVLAALQARRGDRPLFVADLSVPRAIHPAAADVPGLMLVDVDGLQAASEANRLARRTAAEAAEAIIEDDVRAFARWWHGLDVAPAIQALHAHLERLRTGELARIAPGAGRESLDRLSRALVAKIAHHAIEHLKREAAAGRAQAAAARVRAMFGLPPDAA